MVNQRLKAIPITSENIHSSKLKQPIGKKKDEKGLKQNKKKDEKLGNSQLGIGRIMVNWLLSKQLVAIYQADVDIKKGKKERYLQLPSYVSCLFDIKLLPLHITLPMVHPPLEWKIRGAKRKNPDDKIRLRDLTGGYLYSDPKLGGFYSKTASALSTHDESKFQILLHGYDHTRKLTRVLNKLQGTPFIINKPFLIKLENEWDDLQKYGLVLPKILASLDRKEAKARLREFHLNDKFINKYFNFGDLSFS